MPSFCECGSDKYICQNCGRDLCSKDYPSKWLPLKRNPKVSGNHCPSCVSKIDMLSSLKNDPLYNAVLTATSQEEYKKAVDTLLAIRGSQAIELIKKAVLLRG